MTTANGTSCPFCRLFNSLDRLERVADLLNAAVNVLINSDQTGYQEGAAAAPPVGGLPRTTKSAPPVSTGGPGTENTARAPSVDPPAADLDAGRATEDRKPDNGGKAVDLKQWRRKVADHIHARGITQAAFSTEVGVHFTTVSGWLRGSVKPGNQRMVDIARYIDSFDLTFDPSDDPEVLGNLPTVPTEQQAAAYLQKTIASWMRSQRLDHTAAAKELFISKQMLLRILQVHLPEETVLARIVERLPELRPDLPALQQARRMKDKKVA